MAFVGSQAIPIESRGPNGEFIQQKAYQREHSNSANDTTLLSNFCPDLSTSMLTKDMGNLNLA